MGIRTKFASLGGAKTYVEKAWTQTILTENGVVGGTNCACTSSEVAYINGSPRGYYEVFRAFNGLTTKNTVYLSGYWKTGNACSLMSETGYITYYTPTPIKVSKVTFDRPDFLVYSGPRDTGAYLGVGGRPVNKASVYGSNDNTNWTLLKTADTPSGVIDGIQSPDFYKYIKIQSVETKEHKEPIFVNVKIQATYRE